MTPIDTRPSQICNLRHWLVASDPVLSSFSRRAVAACLVSLVVLGVLTPTAGADSIGDKKAEARQIATQLSDLQGQQGVLAERYNIAVERLGTLQSKVIDAKARLGASHHNIELHRREVGRLAIKEYAQGGSTSSQLPLVLNSSSNDLGQRRTYTAAAIGDRDTILNDLRVARDDGERQTVALNEAVANADQAKQEVEAQRNATQQAVDDQKALNDRVQGELAQLVAQEQARQAAEQQRRAEAKARQEAEAARASAPPPAPVGNPQAAPADAPTPATPQARAATPPTPTPTTGVTAPTPTTAMAPTAAPPTPTTTTTPAPTSTTPTPTTTAAPAPTSTTPTPTTTAAPAPTSTTPTPTTTAAPAPTSTTPAPSPTTAAAAPAPAPADLGPPVSSSPRPTPPTPSSHAAGVRAQIVSLVESQVGVPYVFGGSSPSGFDCSGLVQWAYTQSGMSVPRGATDQLHATRRIPLSDLQPGDLVFYNGNDSLMGHVAVYVGNGQIVQALHSGAPVKYDSLYFWDAIAGAGTFL